MEPQEYWSRYQKATPAWESLKDKSSLKESDVRVKLLRKLKSKNLQHK